MGTRATTEAPLRPAARTVGSFAASALPLLADAREGADLAGGGAVAIELAVDLAAAAIGKLDGQYLVLFERQPRCVDRNPLRRSGDRVGDRQLAVEGGVALVVAVELHRHARRAAIGKDQPAPYRVGDERVPFEQPDGAARLGVGRRLSGK